ncbi:hypothetical protein HYDPIDRAFT_92882, partial [Hydnomerulius pinastri MD-312]
QEFGLSRFHSWEVAEAVGIARQHGWIKPTVHQGLYDAIERDVELELLPCLRHFGIRFYAYSPLASSVLTGRALAETDMQNIGRWWDPSVSVITGGLQQNYAPMLPTLREVKALLDKSRTSISEAAYRWLQHHSALRAEPGDVVLIGTSTTTQLLRLISRKSTLCVRVFALIELICCMQRRRASLSRCRQDFGRSLVPGKGRRAALC